MFEFIVEVFAEIADFMIDMWTDKVLKRTAQRRRDMARRKKSAAQKGQKERSARGAKPCRIKRAQGACRGSEHRIIAGPARRKDD